MRIIWNEHIDTISTSRLETNAEGLANYRNAHPEKEYYGYFDIRRSSQYLLAFAHVDEYDDHIYIHQIAVFPDVLRESVGTSLLQYVLDRANQDGKYIELAVQVSNIAAIRFFLKHGFEIEDYSTETKFLPSDFNPEQLSLDNIEEILRLVEYTMRYHPE